MQDTETFFEALQADGIPAMPLLGPNEILQNAHFVKRGTFLRIDHPVLGEEAIFGPMWRQLNTNTENWTHAPLLGQHTLQIMTEVLGMTKKEVDELMLSEALI